MARPLHVSAEDHAYELLCEPVSTASCRVVPAFEPGSRGDYKVSLYGVDGSDRCYDTLHEACEYAVWAEFRRDMLLSVTLKKWGRLLFEGHGYMLAEWLEGEDPAERELLETPNDKARRDARAERELLMSGLAPVRSCRRGDRRPDFAAGENRVARDWATAEFRDRLETLQRRLPRRSVDSPDVFTVVFSLPSVTYGYVYYDTYLGISPTEVTHVPPSWLARGRAGPEDDAVVVWGSGSAGRFACPSPSPGDSPTDSPPVVALPYGVELLESAEGLYSTKAA